MDIIDFIENVCGAKLLSWQKEYIKKLTEYKYLDNVVVHKVSDKDYKNYGLQATIHIIDEQAPKEKERNMKNCKYYSKRVDTIKSYIGCLYRLDDGNCCTGGLLHIVTDDGNLEDHHIKWCLDECIKHPECEESEIGKLICNELLKLPMEQRRLIYEEDWAIEAFCNGKCDECPIHNPEATFPYEKGV